MRSSLKWTRECYQWTGRVNTKVRALQWWESKKRMRILSQMVSQCHIPNSSQEGREEWILVLILLTMQILKMRSRPSFSKLSNRGNSILNHLVSIANRRGLPILRILATKIVWIKIKNHYIFKHNWHKSFQMVDKEIANQEQL